MHRADKRTGIQQVPVRYGLSHIGKPYDLVNVPEGCPRDVTNSCQVENIGVVQGLSSKSDTHEPDHNDGVVFIEAKTKVTC